MFKLNVTANFDESIIPLLDSEKNSDLSGISMKKYSVLAISVSLIILGIAIILLTGCSHAKEDEAQIIQYLDDVYGENSYTLQRDSEYKRNYIVQLKQYPELKFRITVSRQPLTPAYIWSNFDEVFSEYVIEQFTSSNDLGADTIEYVDPQFAYIANVSSLEELKISYDRLMKFINSVSEKFPVLVDTGALDIRMDISGIRLKGDVEDETKYFDICEADKGAVAVKPYDELYAELAPQIKTQSENSNGIIFRTSVGRAFSLGSDTFEDCLYKGLELENAETSDVKDCEKIILAPGEVSGIYTLTGTDNYNPVTIGVQAKNLTNSACSLYDATIVKAVITGSKTFFIGDVCIDLEFDERREWIDPYEALKISPPRNSNEFTEGVAYKNINILFEKNECWKGIKRVTLCLR